MQSLSYLDLPAWINNYPSLIINDAGSSSVIEMGKKKFHFILSLWKSCWLGNAFLSGKKSFWKGEY